MIGLKAVNCNTGDVLAEAQEQAAFRAERGLEGSNAAADGRMIEFQPLGGGDELPGARDREEDSHVVPVHAARI